MATDFDIKLAQLVEKYPAVYDIMNANYHKTDAKKQVWANISREMGITEAKCEIKWKSLKHQYLKHKKESNPTWPLMEFLKFLDAKEGKTKGRKSKVTAAPKRTLIEDSVAERIQDVTISLGQRVTPPKRASSPPSSPKIKRARREGSQSLQTSGQEVSDKTLAATKARGSPATKQRALSKKVVIVLNADDVTQHQNSNGKSHDVPQPSKNVEEANAGSLMPRQARRSTRTCPQTPGVESAENRPARLYPQLPDMETEDTDWEPFTVSEEVTANKKPVPKGRKSRLLAQVSQEAADKAKQPESEASFEKLLCAKLAQVPPEILNTVKASILELIDKAVQR